MIETRVEMLIEWFGIGKYTLVLSTCGKVNLIL